MEIAACSRRLSWCLSAAVVSIVVLHVVAVFGRGGFYVDNGVSEIVESVTCFMLLNPFDVRSAGLSNVVIVTVLAGNFIDGNACKIQIWGKSDKEHVPHLICCEDKKQVAVMFWGCISSRGEEALIPVLGTIDSVKCIDIFLNYLKPSITWYVGNHTEIFQQDNASCHALRIVMEYLNKNDIFTLYWPPQGPDLNIIGNIWHMITR